MDRITKEHLERKAFIYIRQSTLDQVENNLESQRIQYGLRERASMLGWRDIEIIDDDLGRSGSGSVYRAGFERLCHHVCLGEAGAIFCVEASRLARNNREWHTLIEFCGIVHTLIIDHEGIYDPRLLDHRLLLGLKATFSEMELSLFRQRSQMALHEKSKRGELFTTVPIGYKRVGKDGLEKDPDKRVAEGISLVFRKFRELGSARQCLLWFCQQKLEIPYYVYEPDGWQIIWKLPVYGAIHRILTNPIYAGAYAYGRTGSQVFLENGRKKITRGHKRELEDWEVLIFNHHEGYISWEEFEFNQNQLTNNTNQMGAMVRSAVNRGSALLAGLLRCGHCGRKLHVTYSGKGSREIRYNCRGAQLNFGRDWCISFGGLKVDQAVSQAVLEVLTPLGIDAALGAITTREAEHLEIIRQKELILEQAQYEAARAGRQYNTVDPENRLVALELERRWNEALSKVENIKDDLKSLKEAIPKKLSQKEEAMIYELAHDLPELWNNPNGEASLKKRIMRTLLVEIIARANEPSRTIELILHWQGGDHTRIVVNKNRIGHHRYSTDEDTIELLRGLARCLPDKLIASLLNRLGKKTGRGHSWTESKVRSARDKHHIAVYVKGERQSRGEMTLDEAARFLEIELSPMRRLIFKGFIPAKQLCKGAPWIIKKEDLEKEEIKRLLDQVKNKQPISPSRNYELPFE